MESTNNQTFIPLGANKTYLGTYDAVSAYATAKISLIADQNCEIIAYQSQNKKNTSSTVYQAVANVQLEEYLTLANPFVYFTVRNLSSSAQTILNFTVVYSVSQVGAGGGVGSNVNIVSQTAGLALNSSLTTINSTINMKSNSTFWNASSVLAGGVSQSISNGTRPTRSLSVFGNTSAETTLTLQISVDGTNFYDTQSVIVANGNFGYSLTCPFYSIRLKSSDAATITALCIYA